MTDTILTPSPTPAPAPTIAPIPETISEEPIDLSQLNINFTWSIDNLFYYIEQGIVYSIEYSVDAVEGGISASMSGSVEIDYEEGNDFIPYANLTENIVVAWLDNYLDKNLIEYGLYDDIQLIKNPVKAEGLPWVN